VEREKRSRGRNCKASTPGAQTAPKVFTVLLNWNGWQDTLECVRSLQDVTYPNQSVVIVDNGSVGDDVQNLRRELGNGCCIIQNERNEGYCEGNNVGMRHALAQGADYILILNNDTVVAPDFLSHLVAVAGADPGVGIVVPCIYLYDEPQRTAYPRVIDRWPLILHVHLGTFFQFLKAKRLERTTTIRLLDGCCFLVKRKVLEDVGLFDPDYFVVGGSGDLGKLAMDLGCRIVAVPEAMIWAKVARSFGDRQQGALAYAYWAPRSEVLFARKHLTWPHFLLFLTLLPLRTAAWLAAYGRRARTLAIIPAIARGVRDGFRLRITYWPLRGGGREALDGSAVSSRR
jgi:GT2 family glycosyltransferase